MIGRLHATRPSRPWRAPPRLPRSGLVFAMGLAFVAAFLASASVFTVAQTQQALITQFGQPVRTVDHAGLHIRLAFMQDVTLFDRRLLDDELPGQEVILADQRRLIVDCFVRFRIVDPLRYYQAVGPSENAIQGRLGAVVSSSLRRVLGQETLPAVLSAERNRIMAAIRKQVNADMAGFGIAIEDVRIRRADLPAENTQAILARMQSERQRVAKQIRAEGAEAAARIRANAERDRTVLLADAQAKADQLRGQGQEQAIRIDADAFGRDPHFFQVWRTLRAYRDGLASPHTRLVLAPDSTDFLQFLKHAPGTGAP